MFCPRCGRAINENANFCGGCGLSRAEIERFVQTSKVTNEAAQPAEPAQPTAAAEPEVIEPVACEVVAETETVAEPAAAETVTETVSEAEPAAETAEQTATTETSYKYTAPEGAEYHYTAQTNPANSTGTTSYTYAQTTSTAAQSTTAYSTEKPVKNENLSTVDFIWMMLISSIPVVGLIYIIYLAIQDNNTNKRSYARATLIIALFGTLVGVVFGLGFFIAGL